MDVLVGKRSVEEGSCRRAGKKPGNTGTSAPGALKPLLDFMCFFQLKALFLDLAKGRIDEKISN
jgi:hypothetical protein